MNGGSCEHCAHIGSGNWEFVFKGLFMKVKEDVEYGIPSSVWIYCERYEDHVFVKEYLDDSVSMDNGGANL